jgi:hypothetical protein
MKPNNNATFESVAPAPPRVPLSGKGTAIDIEIERLPASRRLCAHVVDSSLGNPNGVLWNFVCTLLIVCSCQFLLFREGKHYETCKEA